MHTFAWPLTFLDLYRNFNKEKYDRIKVVLLTQITWEVIDRLLMLVQLFLITLYTFFFHYWILQQHFHQVIKTKGSPPSAICDLSRLWRSRLSLCFNCSQNCKIILLFNLSTLKVLDDGSSITVISEPRCVDYIWYLSFYFHVII